MARAHVVAEEDFHDPLMDLQRIDEGFHFQLEVVRVHTVTSRLLVFISERSTCREFRISPCSSSRAFFLPSSKDSSRLRF